MSLLIRSYVTISESEESYRFKNPPDIVEPLKAQAG